MDLTRKLISQAKFSIKRICEVMRASRSNQYQNKSSRKSRYVRRDDGEVLKSVLLVTKNRSTYGYPRVRAHV